MVEELDIDLPSAIGDIYLTTALTAASRIDISNGTGVANIVERLEQQSAHRALRLRKSFNLAGQTWWSNLEGLAGDKVWSALNNEQQHEHLWLRVEFLAFAALSDLGDSTLLVQPGRWMLDHPSYFGIRDISAITLSERLRFVYAAHLDERSAKINAIGTSRVVIGIKGGKSTNIAEYTEWLLKISSAPNYTAKFSSSTRLNDNGGVVIV
ncbi:hypothetical protein T492DRAFT_1120755 [Pavlovales sp. CCMP2436]|nr:hypothetical protein T492DRAFT_1120755 [Pavlovales sp. CCMP2436]